MDSYQHSTSLSALVVQEGSLHHHRRRRPPFLSLTAAVMMLAYVIVAIQATLRESVPTNKLAAAVDPPKPDVQEGTYDWKKCKDSQDPDCWRQEGERVHSYWQDFGEKMKSFWKSFGERMRSFWGGAKEDEVAPPDQPVPDGTDVTENAPKETLPPPKTEKKKKHDVMDAPANILP